MPNFKAVTDWIKAKDADGLAPVLKWMEKLESWCTAAVEAEEKRDETMERFKNEIEDLNEAVATANEAATKADQLIEILEDIDRGVADMNDLQYHVDGMPA